uniref:PH domain-containing protein n=1 Tax=Chromera velia CCMP2878 TaxID=1169474 RepID=A0A0G4HE33_9ALVE|eukprot:Cvel_6508.t1-p1 / transcript=Cvel_6508.t1 / gene=Cvel_6508 / organism=Chromera_velia_CCMP2878 / gene_product=hypothetical protein / transcript_product=hypothetical protein / location=Cvel_scaffold319:66711-71516(+) / protein_length=1047 / sequence_SO=supercontig / SO=protein_coding / is_pseudo=false
MYPVRVPSRTSDGNKQKGERGDRREEEESSERESAFFTPVASTPPPGLPIASASNAPGASRTTTDEGLEGSGAVGLLFKSGRLFRRSDWWPYLFGEREVELYNTTLACSPPTGASWLTSFFASPHREGSYLWVKSTTVAAGPFRIYNRPHCFIVYDGGRGRVTRIPDSPASAERIFEASRSPKAVFSAASDAEAAQWVNTLKRAAALATQLEERWSHRGGSLDSSAPGGVGGGVGGPLSAGQQQGSRNTPNLWPIPASGDGSPLSASQQSCERKDKDGGERDRLGGRLLNGHRTVTRSRSGASSSQRGRGDREMESVGNAAWKVSPDSDSSPGGKSFRSFGGPHTTTNGTGGERFFQKTRGGTVSPTPEVLRALDMREREEKGDLEAEGTGGGAFRASFSSVPCASTSLPVWLVEMRASRREAEERARERERERVRRSTSGPKGAKADEKGRVRTPSISPLQHREGASSDSDSSPFASSFSLSSRTSVRKRERETKGLQGEGGISNGTREQTGGSGREGENAYVWEGSSRRPVDRPMSAGASASAVVATDREKKRGGRNRWGRGGAGDGGMFSECGAASGASASESFRLRTLMDDLDELSADADVDRSTVEKEEDEEARKEREREAEEFFTPFAASTGRRQGKARDSSSTTEKDKERESAETPGHSAAFRTPLNQNHSGHLKEAGEGGGSKSKAKQRNSPQLLSPSRSSGHEGRKPKSPSPVILRETILLPDLSHTRVKVSPSPYRSSSSSAGARAAPCLAPSPDLPGGSSTNRGHGGEKHEDESIEVEWPGEEVELENPSGRICRSPADGGGEQGGEGGDIGELSTPMQKVAPSSSPSFVSPEGGHQVERRRQQQWGDEEEEDLGDDFSVQLSSSSGHGDQISDIILEEEEEEEEGGCSRSRLVIGLPPLGDHGPMMMGEEGEDDGSPALSVFDQLARSEGLGGESDGEGMFIYRTPPQSGRTSARESRTEKGGVTNPYVSGNKLLSEISGGSGDSRPSRQSTSQKIPFDGMGMRRDGETPKAKEPIPHSNRSKEKQQLSPVKLEE